MNPLVSVIIPDHNRPEQVISCIQSVLDSEYDNFELMVVDNCSTDSTVMRIYSAFPSVRLIQLPENIGAAGARNEGMRFARGDYFFFVDSDVMIEKNVLKILIETASRHQSLGAIGPLVLYFSDHRPFFVRTRINPTTSKTYYDREIPKGVTELPTHHIPCTWLVSRTVVEKVGMMDPIYRTYYEESDWQGRMGKAGYRNLVCLNATAYHDVPYDRKWGIIAEMVSKDAPKALYHLYHLARNRTIFMKKFSGKFQYYKFLFFYSNLFLCYYLLMLLFRGGFVFAYAYFKGYLRGISAAARVHRIIDGTEDSKRLRLIPATTVL
jgi:GT2 family glycosyltransferase